MQASRGGGLWAVRGVGRGRTWWCGTDGVTLVQCSVEARMLTYMVVDGGGRKGVGLYVIVILPRWRIDKLFDDAAFVL
jgi:hypothetical protein